MEKYIVLNKNISTYYLYKTVLKELLDVYQSDKKNLPILDLRETQYISANAAPVLLAFGDYLRRLYNKPIKIKVSKESGLQNFLIMSKFFEISKKLNIFVWDDDFLDEWEIKKIRDIHNISYTKIRYNDAEKIIDMTQRRDYISDCLYDKYIAIYSEVLNDTGKLVNSIIDESILAIVELETNAIMYSKSYSFTYVATDKYGTKISIADTGVGFEKSFKNSGKRLEYIDFNNQFDKKYKNYIIIMSVLNYSMKKYMEEEREDLWSLMTKVINNNGTFKIQYMNTQVTFSHSRCKECKKNPGQKNLLICSKCLANDYSKDILSPIKIFEVGLQGVRIEITIDKE